MTLTEAKEAGKQARLNEMSRVPAFDKEFIDRVKADSSQASDWATWLGMWLKGWDERNLELERARQ